MSHIPPMHSAPERTRASWRPTRRTVAKGAAWSVPAVVVAAAAPAYAASPVCPVITTSGCWNCDGSNYTFAVFPYGTTGVSVQTSSLLTWPANSAPFTITYTIGLPSGASLASANFNGSWGGGGATWSAPAIAGNKISFTVTPPKTAQSGLCGGIQFDILKIGSGIASFSSTLQPSWASDPSLCPAGPSRRFVRDGATNIKSYGAQAACQGGASWK